METKTSIPTAIWNAKEYKWKPFLKGELATLQGCPNWLYSNIQQLKNSGQQLDDQIQVYQAKNHQYAVQFTGNTIQVFSKK